MRRQPKTLQGDGRWYGGTSGSADPAPCDVFATTSCPSGRSCDVASSSVVPVGPAPSRARMLVRGLLKRCPICGGKKLFTRWFRMKERCPGCGYLFEREEGFFLGAYVMNLAIAQGLVIVLAIVPLIVRLARNPDASVLPFVAGGLVGAVVAPMVFYPWSKTIWTAFDLMLRPVSASEPADRT